MADSKPWRAGVIGLGRMGSTFDDEVTQGGALILPYCHAPSYVASPLTDLVAGADPHPEQRQIFADRWGLAPGSVCETHLAMLESSDLDVVSVCTTARLRAQIIEDCVSAGVKAIWAEKPLALSLEEADRIVSVCEKADVALAVNCARRYNPGFAETRRMVEAGLLGEILQVTCYAQCGLSHNGSHAIDTVRYLAGGHVDWVFGEMESDEAAAGEDDLQGNGYLVFDNGVRAYLRTTRSGTANWDIEIIGTEGHVRSIANAQQFEWTRLADGGLRGRGVPVRGPIATPARQPGMGPVVIEDLLEAANSTRDARCSAIDGREALEVAIALRESHRRGGTRVTLPLEDRTLRILSSETRSDDTPARIRRLEATR